MLKTFKLNYACLVFQYFKMTGLLFMLPSKHMLQRYIQVINASKYETSTNYVLLTTSYDQILQGVPPVFVNASIYDVFVWLHYYVSRANQVFSPEETLRYQIFQFDLVASSNGNKNFAEAE